MTHSTPSHISFRHVPLHRTASLLRTFQNISTRLHHTIRVTFIQHGPCVFSRPNSVHSSSRSIHIASSPFLLTPSPSIILSSGPFRNPPVCIFSRNSSPNLYALTRIQTQILRQTLSPLTNTRTPPPKAASCRQSVLAYSSMSKFQYPDMSFPCLSRGC